MNICLPSKNLLFDWKLLKEYLASLKKMFVGGQKIDFFEGVGPGFWVEKVKWAFFTHLGPQVLS